MSLALGSSGLMAAAWAAMMHLERLATTRLEGIVERGRALAA